MRNFIDVIFIPKEVNPKSPNNRYFVEYRLLLSSQLSLMKLQQFQPHCLCAKLDFEVTKFSLQVISSIKHAIIKKY